jgi:hypothetical protein
LAREVLVRIAFDHGTASTGQIIARLMPHMSRD